MSKDLEDRVNELAVDGQENRTNIKNLKEDIGKIEGKVDDLKDGLTKQKEDIIKAVKEEYVKIVEFEPIKTFVYGLITAVCLVVLYSVLSTAIVSHGGISDDPAFLPTAKQHNSNGP